MDNETEQVAPRSGLWWDGEEAPRRPILAPEGWQPLEKPRFAYDPQGEPLHTPYNAAWLARQLTADYEAQGMLSETMRAADAARIELGSVGVVGDGSDVQQAPDGANDVELTLTDEVKRLVQWSISVEMPGMIRARLEWDRMTPRQRKAKFWLREDRLITPLPEFKHIRPRTPTIGAPLTFGESLAVLWQHHHLLASLGIESPFPACDRRCHKYHPRAVAQ